MTRIILTVGCVGKTYVDENYNNVYDFDKHTLDYKYDKTGYEHLSNEEFKGLPNRKIKDGWFKRYMEDWCELIDSGDYDVVTGWLKEDCVNYLIEKGYDIELVLVECNESNLDAYKERSISRGNSENYWNNLRDYYNKTLLRYMCDVRFKVWVLTKPIKFSDFLVFTGSGLIRDMKYPDRGYKNYSVQVYDKIDFSKIGSETTHYQRMIYTNLILSQLEVSHSAGYWVNITNRQVHDAWALAESIKNPIHKSCVPFNSLSKDVQDLDTKYTDVLNEVGENLFDTLMSIKFIASSPYCLDKNIWYFRG